jgi:hypothetical protein
MVAFGTGYRGTFHSPYNNPKWCKISHRSHWTTIVTAEDDQSLAVKATDVYIYPYKYRQARACVIGPNRTLNGNKTLKLAALIPAGVHVPSGGRRAIEMETHLIIVFGRWSKCICSIPSRFIL